MSSVRTVNSCSRVPGVRMSNMYGYHIVRVADIGGVFVYNCIRVTGVHNAIVFVYHRVPATGLDKLVVFVFGCRVCSCCRS